MHESGKEENNGELEEGRDEYGKEKEKESEGEGETDERIEETAENKDNDGNHVAGDGADLVKNDGDEYEPEDAVEVALSKEECKDVGVDGGQPASMDKEEDQVCEQVNLSAKGEGCDSVDYPQPSSQEDVADVSMTKGELEGRAGVRGLCMVKGHTTNTGDRTGGKSLGRMCMHPIVVIPQTTQTQQTKQTQPPRPH